MTALGGWLKELVLVVLLAVFADMLLPTKAMQKYVRVVMGLSIIAVILQPLTPLFSRDWAAKLAEYTTEQVFGTTDSSQTSSNTGVLQDIIRKQQDNQANQILATQLISQLESRFDCTPISLQIAGVSQGGSDIQVNVTLDTVDAGKSTRIQDWIATQLGIPLQQVQVKTA